jgi:hypothetical protein
MYMGPARLVKYPGKENFVYAKLRSTNRASSLSGPSSFKAMDASCYMHKSTLSVTRIGKNRRFYKFAVRQKEAADRTALGRTRAAFLIGGGPWFITPRFDITLLRDAAVPGAQVPLTEKKSNP